VWLLESAVVRALLESEMPPPARHCTLQEGVLGIAPESREYYELNRAESKTRNQAIRALGRHLARVIWSMMKNSRDYVVQEVSIEVT